MGVICNSIRKQVRNPIPQEYVDRIVEETVYLINITEQDWAGLARTYGTYTILGCRDGEEYTVLPIHGAIERMDNGDWFSDQTTNVQAIAEDLCEQINGKIMSVAGGEARVFMGVFISATEEPAPKALAEARKKLLAFAKDQVSLADQLWDDPRNHKDISALHRRCANILGVKKPWTYEPTQMILCIACGESISPNVIVCRTCGVVQPGKEAEARKYFPERYAQNESEPLTEHIRKPRKQVDPS